LLRKVEIEQFISEKIHKFISLKQLFKVWCLFLQNELIYFGS